MEISLTRDSCSVSFPVERDNELSNRDICHALETLQDPPLPGVKFLLEGIRSPGLAEKRPFVLKLPAQNKSLCWDGERLVERDCQPSEKLELTVKNCSGVAWGNWQKNARVRSELSAIVGQRAYLSGIPVSLDGRAVRSFPSSFERERIVLAFEEFEQSHCQGEKIPFPRFRPPTLEASSVPLVATGFRTREYHDTYTWWSPGVGLVRTRWEEKNLRSSGERLQPRHSYVLWVQHGIILEKETLTPNKTGVQLDMYLPVGDLPLDASGMKLIDSEERMERLGRLHPLMLRLLSFDVSAPPSQVKKSQTDSHLNLSLTMGVLGFLLAGWTGLHHSFPLFTAVGMGAGLWGVFDLGNAWLGSSEEAQVSIPVLIAREIRDERKRLRDALRRVDLRSKR